MSNVHVPAGVVVEKSPVALEITAAALLFVDLYLAFAIAMRDGKQDAELIGYTSGAAFILLIVLGIARLFGKGKTRRGRALIAVWTLGIILLSNLSNLSKTREPQPASEIRTATHTPA